MNDNIISIKPNPSPEPTRDNLRLITARNLPPTHLVAAVRAAGFEVHSTGPKVYQHNDDLAHPYINAMYIGECLCEGFWYGVTTLTAISDDKAFQANARLVVEVAAIHRAAAGE